MGRKDFLFEVCANSIESCIQAQLGGADRVELCSGLSEGGITPSYATIKEAREVLDIKLNVIIRPRGGDFHYSPLELKMMENDIRMAGSLGADGVVIGCLNTDGSIDMNATERLCEKAGNMSVTFHRAFDCCKNPEEALEQLVSLKIDRILTSGAEASASIGTRLLCRLHKQAAGRIHLLAGCGVNETNIADIYHQTGIHEYHFSARDKFPSSMTFVNRRVFMGSPDVDEYTIETTSAEKVVRTINALIKSE